MYHFCMFLTGSQININKMWKQRDSSLIEHVQIIKTFITPNMKKTRRLSDVYIYYSHISIFSIGIFQYIG